MCDNKRSVCFHVNVLACAREVMLPPLYLDPRRLETTNEDHVVKWGSIFRDMMTTGKVDPYERFGSIESCFRDIASHPTTIQRLSTEWMRMRAHEKEVTLDVVDVTTGSSGDATMSFAFASLPTKRYMAEWANTVGLDMDLVDGDDTRPEVDLTESNIKDVLRRAAMPIDWWPHIIRGTRRAIKRYNKKKYKKKDKGKKPEKKPKDPEED